MSIVQSFNLLVQSDCRGDLETHISLVLRDRGVARLRPGRGHMGTEEQGPHRAARTGPRVSVSESKWHKNWHYTNNVL